MTRRAIQAVAWVLIFGITGCCVPKKPVPTATVPPLPTATVAVTVTPVATQVLLPTTVPSTSAAPLPTSEPTGVPDSGYLGVRKQGGALGGTWTLKDARVGAHEDRFRVAIEVAEPRDRAPFFEVVEVDNAAVPFPTGHDPGWGVARIDLMISDLYLFDFPVGERLPIAVPENPVVTRVDRYPTESDAHIGFSIGLREPVAYEAYYLTEPVRIVIDVLYP